jgi:hypothetical protein
MALWAPLLFGLLLLTLTAPAATIAARPALAAQAPSHARGPASVRVKPAPTPAPLPSYQSDWNALPVGSTPNDWIDPERDGYHYSWLYPGNWHIVPSPTNPVVQYYEQSQQRPQPALTFRRYDGMAFGQSNGDLPAVYHFDVTFRPIQSTYFFAPVGEAAVQVYYLDPTHYIEIDVRNTQVLLWEDDGGFPGQASNWILYWTDSLRTYPGQDRRVGADVDTLHHLLTVSIEGRAVTTLNLPFITNRPHWVALRAAGQWLDYETVRIQELAPPHTVPNMAPASGQTFGAPPWWQSPKRLALLALCALVVLGQCAWLIWRRHKVTASNQQSAINAVHRPPAAVTSPQEGPRPQR